MIISKWRNNHSQVVDENEQHEKHDGKSEHLGQISSWKYSFTTKSMKSLIVAGQI